MIANSVTDREELNVLVVGNNPTELGRVFDSLGNVQNKKVNTETAFDLRSIFDRLVNFKPSFILIDDNIGIPELKLAVQALLKSRKTREIPITVLKNSNYHEAINIGVMNYILKKDLTGDSLYSAFRNSLKSKITQRYLFEAYKKRTGQLKRLLKNQI